MKLAKDIKVGDIPYQCYYSESGVGTTMLRRFPDITFICKPDKNSLFYNFKCGHDYEFVMREFDCFGTNTYVNEPSELFIVPENESEIIFLNKLLSMEYKHAQNHIRELFRTILGIN